MQEVGAPSFVIKAGNFEGPLDLLLSLIESHKLSISDVALAAVADEYAASVRSRGTMPLDEAAQFILTAATLLLLKSRSLLPSLAISETEEGDVQELEERLRRLEALRALSRALGRQWGKRVFFTRQHRPDKASFFAPGNTLTPENILAAAHAVIANVPEAGNAAPQVSLAATVRIEQVMRELAERVERARSVQFAGLCAEAASRVGVIIQFLALLELVKRGAVLAFQESEYTDITIEVQEVGVPRYE